MEDSNMVNFSFEDGLDAEREGYTIQPKHKSEGFNAGLKLSAIEFKSVKNDDTKFIAVFTFVDGEGGTFKTNVQNPFNARTPEEMNANLNDIRHFYGAFIASPEVEVISAKGVKKKIKQCFLGFKPTSFQNMHEILVSKFSTGYNEIPVTLKMIYYKANLGFPKFPPYISTAWNGQDVNKWVWNDKYDKLESDGSNKKATEGDTPDTEDGDPYGAASTPSF